jgi:hypothetical protein
MRRLGPDRRPTQRSAKFPPGPRTFATSSIRPGPPFDWDARPGLPGRLGSDPGTRPHEPGSEDGTRPPGRRHAERRRVDHRPRRDCGAAALRAKPPNKANLDPARPPGCPEGSVQTFRNQPVERTEFATSREDEFGGVAPQFANGGRTIESLGPEDGGQSRRPREWGDGAEARHAKLPEQSQSPPVGNARIVESSGTNPYIIRICDHALGEAPGCRVPRSCRKFE